MKMHGGAHEKTYEKTGIRGCISLKKRVQTSVVVAVVKTEDSDTPNYPATYFTQCLSHRTKAGWSTRSKAIKGARVPADWCRRCATRAEENDNGGVQ
jgi:hypothetical protein